MNRAKETGIKRGLFLLYSQLIFDQDFSMEKPKTFSVNGSGTIEYPLLKKIFFDNLGEPEYSGLRK